MLSTVLDYLRQLDVVHSGYDQIKLTAILLVLWTYLFFIVEYTFKFPKISKQKSNDTKNRVVSIVHGLLTLCLSTYSLFLSG